MNRLRSSRMDPKRGEDPRLERKSQRDDEDIIKVPDFDYSDLIEKYKLSLVGRMFHRDGRSVDALITHMPRRRIWDVEGRVRGTNLGNNKFQFDFDKEEDMLKVLNRRPCHFNKWTFSLERWAPTINENYPNTLLLWVSIIGIPPHYKKDESYRSIGLALGEVDTVDVAGGRRISHEEGTCPELTPEQRETNRLKRIAEKEQEEQAAKEAFSFPVRGNKYNGHPQNSPVERSLEGKKPDLLKGSSQLTRDKDYARLPGNGDLRKTISDRRESSGKTVWNRLEGKYEERHDERHAGRFPRNRERFHPYHNNVSNYRSSRYKEQPNHGYSASYSVSSSEWRAKEIHPQDRVSERRIERTEQRSKSRRGSPDSQRTISDIQRYNRSNDKVRRESPPRKENSRMEWQPVRREITREESRGGEDRSTRREEDDHQRLRGKAILRDERSMERHSIGRYTSNSPVRMLTREKPESSQGNPQKSISSSEHAKETGLTSEIEKQKPKNNVLDREQGRGDLEQKKKALSPGVRELPLYNEEEMNKIAEQYAGIEMDAEMLDNDDLLDDLTPEATTDENMAEAELVAKAAKAVDTEDLIIATGQASPISATTISKDKKTKPDIIATEGFAVKDRKVTSLQGKRRGQRSPDSKGISASRKLAARGRGSPRGKLIRSKGPSSTKATSSTRFPRMEVFPASIKNNQSCSKPGSVVSQKPSSTRI
ncbi:hypothetical protein Bca52824_002750 [Brassica carinata]|uniref:DUF4283 domain-containing protein n=1 Tax=Brassica carinata TaxID=52824 RepID=A0A8X8BE58_BRACI|nr:hypothetical protein Bca52824_002750 [Brassica carinata]